MPRDAEELKKLYDARHAGVSVQTVDEGEAAAVAEEAARLAGLPVWRWNVLDGLREAANPDRPIAESDNPAAGLFWMAYEPQASRERCVQVIADIAGHLDDPRTLRALRVLLERNAQSGSTAVLIDHRPLPEVVRAGVTAFELRFPDGEAVERIVRETLRAVHKHTPIEVDMTHGQFATIIKNLSGLRKRQIEQVVRDVVADDRRFDEADLNHVLARKRSMLGADGALEAVESPASLDEVGGLGGLKAWLAQRARSFEPGAAAYGLRPPRGVLLLGVQGAGKSLCAKAIATAWGRPLLRLDPGRLYDRYVGESERRLRDALAQGEAMAPIVLWVDEIEKGFASAASQSTDGGLSQRMFGALLTWMQDHTAPVFLVATANDIEALPPELLRKGRFDEIFFVDLPGAEAREAIFAIHLRKRGRDPGAFDLDALSAATAGYSGAEIEQAVVAALHAAYDAGGEPTTDSVLACAAASPPLSVTMGERIEALRQWAADRCVPADTTP